MLIQIKGKNCSICVEQPEHAEVTYGFLVKTAHMYNMAGLLLVLNKYFSLI